MSMKLSVLIPSDIKYLNDMLLDIDGNLKIVSYEVLKDVPQNDISLFCLNNGIYNLPTIELLEFLYNEIKDYYNETIEIGSGNGVMAKALGIQATDSYQQLNPEFRLGYSLLNQPIVKYGLNVDRVSGNDAILKYRPKVCIGAWITYRYSSKESWRGGNIEGIDEVSIIDNVKKYIFIGNKVTHKNSPLLSIKHRDVKADWLLSRSLNKEDNFIGIWDGRL